MTELKIGARLNNNEIVLLGLLEEKPRYGYEIDKIIAERGMREWTDIAFSSIYAVLRGLETKALVEAKTEVTGNRARKRYSLTKTGQRTLKEEVGRLLSEPAPVNDPFMLGLANIRSLDMGEAADRLGRRRAIMATQVEQLTARKNQVGGDVFVGALFDRTIANLRAEVRFLDDLGEKMEERGTPKTRRETKVAELVPQIMPAIEAEPPAVSEPESPSERQADVEAPKDTLF
jgi:DNA-binding PadR family transcriptional regulator